MWGTDLDHLFYAEWYYLISHGVPRGRREPLFCKSLGTAENHRSRNGTAANKLIGISRDAVSGQVLTTIIYVCGEMKDSSSVHQGMEKGRLDDYLRMKQPVSLFLFSMEAKF